MEVSRREERPSAYGSLLPTGRPTVWQRLAEGGARCQCPAAILSPVPDDWSERRNTPGGQPLCGRKERRAEEHSEWAGKRGDGDDTVAGLPQSKGQRAAKSPEDFSCDDGIELEEVQQCLLVDE